MTTVSQISEMLEQILEVEANQLAKTTGFIKRERLLTGADFAQSLIFGFLQEPHLSLCGLSQVAGRREVSISASGLCQRFSREAGAFMQEVLHRLTLAHLQSEIHSLPLLSRFSAVIVEDSTTISLPDALHELWPVGKTGKAALKLFVQLDLLSGTLAGPILTKGRHADCKSPFELSALPKESLYLADLGFFSLARLHQISGTQEGEQRFFVTRYQVGTALFDTQGSRLDLAAVLPTKEGAICELEVTLGADERLPARLILQRVSQQVAEQRRERIRASAKAHGREASQQALYLAGWSIVLTNVPASRLDAEEVLVLLAARWQIERLFWLWKKEAAIDKCNSHNPWRILCECYAKLAAVVICHWLTVAGSWADDCRSLVKAAQVVRRECNRIMVALWEGNVEDTLRSILPCMSRGCRQEKRRTFPGTAQALQEGHIRTSNRGQPRQTRQPRQVRYWPMGKGWACSGRASRRQSSAAFLT